MLTMQSHLKIFVILSSEVVLRSTCDSDNKVPIGAEPYGWCKRTSHPQEGYISCSLSLRLRHCSSYVHRYHLRERGRAFTCSLSTFTSPSCIVPSILEPSHCRSFVHSYLGAGVKSLAWSNGWSHAFVMCAVEVLDVFVCVWGNFLPCSNIWRQARWYWSRTCDYLCL